MSTAAGSRTPKGDSPPRDKVLSGNSNNNSNDMISSTATILEQQKINAASLNNAPYFQHSAADYGTYQTDDALYVPTHGLSLTTAQYNQLAQQQQQYANVDGNNNSVGLSPFLPSASHISGKALSVFNDPTNDNVICSHTHNEEHCGHQECESEQDRKRYHSRKILKIVTLMCFFFMCVELVGGYLSGSLAIMTDAAHLMSDLVSFAISLTSITLSTKKPNSSYSFGYHRIEIIGAILSILMIWILTAGLVYEAINRILHPELIEVEGGIMLVVACIGFTVNVVMGLILILSGEGHSHSHGGDDHGHSHGHDHGHGHHSDSDSDSDSSDDEDHHHGHGHHHGHDEETGLLATKPSQHFHDHHDVAVFKEEKEQNQRNFIMQFFANVKELIFPTNNSRTINIQAAVLHVLGDLTQSAGVIIAAIIIIVKPTWKIFDPICTLTFSVIVLSTTSRVMKQAMNVLMEGTPADVDLNAVAQSLKEINGVVTVHDLHIWSLSVDSPALAVHLVVNTQLGLGGSSGEVSPGTQHVFAADLLKSVNKMLKKKYKITHTTIQIEEQFNHGVCHPKVLHCKRLGSAQQL